MKILKFIIYIFLFSILHACFSDSVKPNDSGLFIKFFGGVQDETAYSMKASQDGNSFFIIGSSNSFGNDQQIFFTKIDQNGNRSWPSDKILGGSFGEEGRDILERANGNLLILGYTTDSSNHRDMLLLETDPEGNVLDADTIGFENEDEEGFYLFESEDRITMIGTSTRANATERDMYVVVKSLLTADTANPYIINQTYGLFDNQETVGPIILNPDNQLIWVSTLNRANETDMRIVVVDLLSGIQLVKTYGTNNGLNDTGEFIHTLPNGDGYILVGSSQMGDNIESKQIFLVNIDNQGLVRWEQRLNTPLAAEAQSVFPTEDGHFIIAGTEFRSEQDTDMILLKADGNGSSEPLWIESFGGDIDRENDVISPDYGQLALQTADLGFLLLGTVRLAKNDIIAVVRTDSQGEVSKP